VADERARARQRALLRLAWENTERYAVILNEERALLNLPPRRPRGARPAEPSSTGADAPVSHPDRADSKP
jgi:hypothetical protein